MRKKVIALLLASLMLFGVTACNKTPKPDDEEVVTSYETVTKSPDYAKISDETLATYTTYYFNNSNDASDAKAGTSKENPKKSLEEAERIISEVKAGVPTRILFKAGSSWSGELEIKGFEAAEATPLLVGVYDVSDEAKYAKIEGGTTLITVQGSNVRVSGFEVTSPQGKRGIVFKTSGGGETKNVVISGNYIHDVHYNWQGYLSWLEDSAQDKYAALRGKLPRELDDKDAYCANPQLVIPSDEFGYGNGGIFTESGTDKTQGKSWFDSCWIEDNIIENVGRSGMFIDAGWYYKPGHNWGSGRWYEDENGNEYNVYPSRNMIIRRNTISYAGGDSIVLLGTNGGYIEDNVSYHANFLGRTGYYNAGIWPHSCRNVIIQGNESAYTHLDNGAGDGQGFDIDIGCSNITFRFNYSHHNAGGGLLLANAGSVQPLYDRDGNKIRDEYGIPSISAGNVNPRWENNVVCNNVFVDNVKQIKFDGALHSIDIYNNTFISSATSATQTIFSSHDPYAAGAGKSWTFRNNVIALRNPIAQNYANNEYLIKADNVGYACFENNVFCNFVTTNDAGETIFDPNGTYDETKSYLPNASGNVVLDAQLPATEAAKGYANAKTFMAGNSAVYSAGKKLAKANKTDFNGNDVEGILYAGAFGKNQ